MMKSLAIFFAVFALLFMMFSFVFLPLFIDAGLVSYPEAFGALTVCIVFAIFGLIVTERD